MLYAAASLAVLRGVPQPVRHRRFDGRDSLYPVVEGRLRGLT